MLHFIIVFAPESYFYLFSLCCCAFCSLYQSVGRRSMYVGTTRVKSHVIRAQNASKLGEKALQNTLKTTFRLISSCSSFPVCHARIRFQDFRIIISSSSSSFLLQYLLTRTDFFTKRLHSQWRCGRTPSDRLSLAVNSYGRSWGSSRADTERRP